MKKFPAILIRLYRFLLYFYPLQFRVEFEEQMLLDFSDFATDADRKGKFALIGFCIRELVDFPLNVLKAHFREGAIFRKLRSQPVNTGIRGALGFGLGFACNPVWISSLLYFIFDPTIVYLSARVYTMIQIDVTDLLWEFSLVVFLAVNSVMFGLSIALFLGNRSNFSRYVIVGALCWVIPEILTYVLVGSLRFEYYQNENLAPFLSSCMLLLVGVFLSAAYPIAESNRNEQLKYLSLGLIIYPLGTYLFLQLLFYVWREVMLGFGISLIAFVITLIVGVIVVATTRKPKQYLVVLSGAIGYFLLNRAIFYIASHIPTVSIAPEFGIAPDILLFPFYYMAVYRAILGAFFGLILGLMFGSQIKNTQSLITAEN